MIGARFAPFQNLTAHYLLADLYLSGPPHDDPPGDEGRPATRSGALWEAMEEEIGGPDWVRETLGGGTRRRRAAPARWRRSSSRRTTAGGRLPRARLRDTPQIAHVQSVYVAPGARAARGRGGARWPRRAAMSREHGYDARRARRPASRTTARSRSYERLGFVEYQRRFCRSRSTSSTSGVGRRAARGVDGPRRSCRRTTRRGRAGGGAVRPAPRPFGADRRVDAAGTAGSTVDDELCDRDPKALRRLARSSRTAPAASCSRSAVEEGEVVRYVLLRARLDRGRVRVGAGVTTASCRRAT